MLTSWGYIYLLAVEAVIVKMWLRPLQSADSRRNDGEAGEVAVPTKIPDTR